MSTLDEQAHDPPTSHDDLLVATRRPNEALARYVGLKVGGSGDESQRLRLAEDSFGGSDFP